MSLTAMPAHVQIVDQTGSIPPEEMAAYVGAQNAQIQHDFAPRWHVRASVGSAPRRTANTWTVYVQEQLDEAGALGYHADAHGQPVAFVLRTADWTVTASHEILEMLVDPWGYRMHRARLPVGLESQHDHFGIQRDASYVHYLLEVCDPPEALPYEVGGVRLSDFLLPAWYRSTALEPMAFSQAAGCTEPREVIDGGYVSFANEKGEWFQVFNRRGKLSVSDLGKFGRENRVPCSLREWTDTMARKTRGR